MWPSLMLHLPNSMRTTLASLPHSLVAKRSRHRANSEHLRVLAVSRPRHLAVPPAVAADTAVALTMALARVLATVRAVPGHVTVAASTASRIAKVRLPVQAGRADIPARTDQTTRS